MSTFDERLERDLGHIADRATPSPTAWEAIQTRIAEQADQPEMEIIMLEKAPPPQPRTGLWIMSAAAAVLLIVGAIVVLTRSGDEPAAVFVGQDEEPEETVEEDSAPEPVAPEEAAPEPDEPASETELETAAEEAAAAVEAAEAEAAVVIAEQFMAARAAHDGDAVRALVADDASIVGFDWIDTPDEYPALVQFERVGDFGYLDPACDGAQEGGVRCTYTLENTVSRALGVGPLTGNSFLLVVEGGLITEVNHEFNNRDYVELVEAPFRAWLEDDHADDVPLLYESTTGAPIVTDESLVLWEDRIAGFVEAVGAEQAFADLPVWSGLQWGEVRARDFEPRMSFAVPEGIGKVCTSGATDSFDLVPLRGEPVAATRTNTARMNVARLEPTTVDATVAAIAAEAGSSTAPVEASIGGAPGVTFDATTGGDVDNATSVINSVDCGMLWAGDGTEWRFWVVDVAGEIVTFGLFATDGELESYATELRPILDSVVWQDLDAG